MVLAPDRRTHARGGLSGENVEGLRSHGRGLLRRG
jgi:hypothetical protein